MPSLPEALQTLDPSDPYRRVEQTFPALDANQRDRVAAFGDEMVLADGDVVFRRGERRVAFFLILEGSIEIVAHGDTGEQVITTHGASQFTGELDLFNDRKILVDGRAAGPTRVVRLQRVSFQRMMVAEPDIAELITRALILRRVGLIRHDQGGVRLVGDPHDGETLSLARFLKRNGYPVRVVPPDSADGLPEGARLPALQLPQGGLLENPSRADVAEELGLSEQVKPDHVHDVAVVGAGPSGLAAAVYAASEGLDTVVIEQLAPGGQAGTSSRIENYLGFPTGISGQALAGRAQVQAQKFGARLVVSRAVSQLECGEDGHFGLTLECGATVRSRSVVVATGATYRTLDLERYAHFERHGIHYAATAMEAELCHEEEVVVVGGGNSAGQAAVFLSRFAKDVHMLIRSESLAASMSDYLIGRLEAAPNIHLRYRSQLSKLHGEKLLEAVTWVHRGSGEATRRPVRNVFVMIGAKPNTAWLGDCVELDDRGFVVTDARDGQVFVASRSGIYAVGDVRSGSVKRVASAVGQGSVVISGLHRHLAGL